MKITTFTCYLLIVATTTAVAFLGTISIRRQMSPRVNDELFGIDT